MKIFLPVLLAILIGGGALIAYQRQAAKAQAKHDESVSIVLRGAKASVQVVNLSPRDKSHQATLEGYIEKLRLLEGESKTSPRDKTQIGSVRREAEITLEMARDGSLR